MKMRHYNDHIKRTRRHINYHSDVWHQRMVSYIEKPLRKDILNSDGQFRQYQQNEESYVDLSNETQHHRDSQNDFY